MKITFYGVRGSIPTPGKDTSRYGGNTPCIVIESQSGQKLILDAGTGLRVAAQEFMEDRTPIHMLLSHHHWDHIQGFPFFDPIYEKDRQITIYPGDTTDGHDTAILEQMSKSYFPVKFHQLPATITIKKANFLSGVEIGEFYISAIKMNHPDGGAAYKIQCDDKTLVYATDNELRPPESHHSHNFDEWVRFCDRADLLIHDAQYIDAEMGHKLGWGHSSISDTLNLAELAGVKLLCLFSHDPKRTDEQLDDLTAKLLVEKPPFGFFFAKEERSINL